MRIWSLVHPPFPPPRATLLPFSLFLHFMWSEKSLELQAIAIIWKIMIPSWSISSNIFLTLEDEIKSSLFEKEPYEELEEDIYQILNENKWKCTRKSSSLYSPYENLNLHPNSNLLFTLHQNTPLWAWILTWSFYIHTNNNLKTTF